MQEPARSVPDQGRLDEKEILYHTRYVDALREKSSVCDVVSHPVMIDGSSPLIGAFVQNQSQAVSETQPRVFRIVQAPRTAGPPVAVRLSLSNGVPACVIDLGFQLSPGQDEVCLVVDSLLSFDAVAFGAVSGCIAPVAQIVEIIVDLFVQGRNRRQIIHSTTRRSQSRVNASRWHRWSARATCQSGASKFSAESTIW